MDYHSRNPCDNDRSREKACTILQALSNFFSPLSYSSSVTTKAFNIFSLAAGHGYRDPPPAKSQSGFIAVLSYFLSEQDGLLVIEDSSERAILAVTDVLNHYFSLWKRQIT